MVGRLAFAFQFVVGLVFELLVDKVIVVDHCQWLCRALNEGLR